MSRLFVYLIIILCIVWLWRRWQGALARAARSAAGPAAGVGEGTAARGAGPARLSEPMVPCAECGVFVPVSQSVSMADENFCCVEHGNRYMGRSAGGTSQ